ncbi:MAG: CYTH domain-containing protein [Deltaproteobacteria bacterium]|jgi:adenylate cyclase|nr:CYTH domain-containing protein [Deltaproteobacteria bacterium]
MHLERERKFLVRGDAWRAEATRKTAYTQGYLAAGSACAIRVRLAGDAAWLTIKGPSVNGAAPEFEYSIPAGDAALLLDSLAIKPLIEKTRHFVPYAGLTWEVDEFFGANAGLVLAEIELSSPDQPVPLPPWAGEEVTGDARYHNACLAANPFTRW